MHINVHIWNQLGATAEANIHGPQYHQGEMIGAALKTPGITV